LYDKDGGAKIYPASLTKIMTAVVALEMLGDLDEGIMLEQGIFSEIYQEDAVTAGFLPNEEVRAIDLLYGMMLPSGAECAIGLAEHLAGSEAEFAKLMNAKAQQLGMDGTHFTNAVGLHDAGHFSTVRDIAVLLRYALGNSTFYQIFTSDWHSSQPTGLHPDGISFSSSLFSIIGSGDFPGGAIVGGKTGFTDEAGLCLASLALKDGGSFILVTSQAPGGPQGQSPHIDDAFTVYSAIVAQ
jgi:D-alanyl-D-alanine carboxypeptidase (penicillin-binding protein 5/6)